MKSEYEQKPFPFPECRDCSYRIGRVRASISPHCCWDISYEDMACDKELCYIEFPSMNSEQKADGSREASSMINLLNENSFKMGGGR